MIWQERTSAQLASSWGLAAAILALVISGTACVGKERYAANISYWVGPKQPLPEGLKAVAVIDSAVQTVGASGDDREQKWSTVAADMIEAMLQGSGAGLVVAKRRETQRILAERDLNLAGLVDGPTAARAGKLLAVQGLITSKITIRVDVQKGRKSTIDWVSLMGGMMRSMQETRDVRRREPVVYREGRPARDPRYWRNPHYVRDPRYVYVPRPRPGPVYREETTAAGGGLSLKTKDVEEISRHLTVQCSFALMDAVTGRAIAQYSPPPYQKRDKASPHFLFGSSMSEADLDPVDHFIGELVERATQEFVGMLVPVRVECRYDLIGKGKDGEAGIRALRADDYATAIARFQAELAKKPREHETVFALGVAYELMGDREHALECYRRAASMEGVDKDDLAVYLAAKERLTDHIGRIVPPPGQVPAAPPAEKREEPVSAPPPPVSNLPPVSAPAEPTAAPAPAPPPVESAAETKPATATQPASPAAPASRGASGWTWTLPASRPASLPTSRPG